MLNPKSFTCERCGECCKKLYILLSDSDISRIESFDYRMNDFSEIEPLGEYKGKRVLKKINGKCVFLENKDGKFSCSIYESRPEICKKYPFFGKEVESCKPRI
jgi:Fe-S-cluster containining protein